MKAEIGIDDEGRACIVVADLTHTEWVTFKRLQPWLPAAVDALSGEIRITGDRLPGMGNLTAQDATAPSVSTEESIARVPRKVAP